MITNSVLELKSLINPSGKDFMDFWLVSVVLPWGALWIWWTCRPLNPLIELSLPEEKTIKGVSGWLQKHGHRSCVSWLWLGSTQSTLMLISVSSRHGGGELFKDCSLWGSSSYSPSSTGEGMSPYAFLYSPWIFFFNWAHWYPTEALETCSMIRKTAIKEKKMGTMGHWVCFIHALYRSCRTDNNNI